MTMYLLFLLSLLVVGDFTTIHSTNNELKHHPSLQLISNCSIQCQLDHPEGFVRPTGTELHYPTVDIFFMYQYHSTYYFFTLGTFWLPALIAKKFSKYNPDLHTDDTRIHIFADSDEILYNASHYYGFYAHDMRAYYSNYSILFDRMGKTSTSLAYELTLRKWFIFQQVMNQWNRKYDTDHHLRMTRILCLDGDVMMTMNAARFYQKVLNALSIPSITAANSHLQDVHYLHSPPQNKPIQQNIPHKHRKHFHSNYYEFINLAYGVCGLFSVKGLNAFGDYVFDWFMNGSEEDVIERSKKLGDTFFSDMLLQREFVKNESTKHIRNNCYEYDGVAFYESKWKLDVSNQCLIQALGCVPMNDYFTMIHPVHRFVRIQSSALADGVVKTIEDLFDYPFQKKSNISFMDDISIQGNAENYPYCYMHFAGDYKKQLYFYGKLLDALLPPSSFPPQVQHAIAVHNGSRATRNLLYPVNHYINKGMLFTMRRIRKVFFFNFTTQRAHPTNSLDSFDGLETYTFVVGAIPQELVRSLPSGEPID